MVKDIESRSDFDASLESAGGKLVVVDFYAVWCGPCTRIAPVIDSFALKYPNAVFLKVNVDKNQEISQVYSVTAMPTFIFLRNKVKIDDQRGADPNALEDKIKQHYDAGDAGSGDTPVKGHMDLTSMIAKSGCECLNESDEHTLAHALTSKGGYLESDCDEQLIISLTFSQAVKLHSLKMHGPAEKAPKIIKVFTNLTKTLDFDNAESMGAVQEFELTPDDVGENSLIQLRYVKFQNVQNLTIFVKNNQTDAETTQIDHLAVYGSPINCTNMSEFKRVAGKKGESE